ncbi:outer membrane protein assembly factor BamD [Holospora elegans E1]|uniref:Outer membrane protein assembly factor BamD n=1 Tax=Holospora elegans E1 TaxID=1427503 RepID=A0A023DZ08_9PROT|nr:outer membrane protein assembly factor BamD [Holospora elegans]GAJ46250.1 outer membrane protein assembly factor BamD [Holospora elegans E1]
MSGLLTFTKRWKTLSCLWVFLMICSGCRDSERIYQQKPLNVLYKKAMSELKKEDFKEASVNFDEIERQYPYSSWAPHSQLMSAYCSFKAQEFFKSIATLETFLSLHPASPSAKYAHYLRALCYYTDMLSPERDSENALLALQGFQEICQRFPYSDYARDAEVKMDFIKEHLACQEMLIIRDYMKRKEFISAFQRLSFFVKNYPKSVLIPEALYRLIECHIVLGFPGLTYKTFTLLKYNFPGDHWTSTAKELLASEKTEGCSKKISKSNFKRRYRR